MRPGSFLLSWSPEAPCRKFRSPVEETHGDVKGASMVQLSRYPYQGALHVTETVWDLPLVQLPAEYHLVTQSVLADGRITPWSALDSQVPDSKNYEMSLVGKQKT